MGGQDHHFKFIIGLDVGYKRDSYSDLIRISILTKIRSFICVSL